MASNLPGLNYNSKLSIDDLSYYQQSVEKEILNRTTLVLGGDSLSTPRYGIVDIINPRNLISSETTRPLAVYQSAQSTTRVNIAPGSVVTPNGCLVKNEVAVENFELARTLADDTLVVFLENEIINTDPVRITIYNAAQPVRLAQSSDVVRSALLTDYNNPVLFPPTRIANIVVICVVRVVNTITGLELQYDYSSASYSFNRPWYSPVDVEHRSQVGSGTATDKNPHGTSFNDLTSGPLTLYNQVLPFGMLQCRDSEAKGLPGALCTETIEASRVLTDISGVLTQRSRFGGPGAKYVVITRYPAAVANMHLVSHKGRSIAFDWIPGTRIVVIPAAETISSTASFYYTEVEALSPPLAILSNNLVFSQPNSSTEVVYSGGVSFSELANNTIDFDGTGPVPRNFKLFVRSNGTLLRSPELVQSTVLLDSIGTSLFPISSSYFGPARISIGLADANTVSSMAVTLRVYGKDTSGTAISEDLVFSGSNWTNVVLPGVETENQSRKTTKTFASVQNIQVISRSNDGPGSKIVMFAELETGTTPALNELAQVASLTWDGLAVGNLLDARKIVRNIPETRPRFGIDFIGTGGTNLSTVCAEDLADPRLMERTPGTQTATNAKFSIFIDDYAFIVAGDTILFPNGTLLTAITAGVPNRTLGQFLADVSNADTRTDMIATINDPGLSSGVVATTTTDSTEVFCTVSISGARGNGPVTKPLAANPGAISISAGGAVGGIDAYGETYLPHQQDYIDTALPSVLAYDVSGYRGRYLSRGIPIGNKQRITVYVHGTEAPHTNVQLRARVSTGSGTEWLPWEVISGNGRYFTFTKSSPITKVQLELFGKLQGYTLFEGDI